MTYDVDDMYLTLCAVFGTEDDGDLPVVVGDEVETNKREQEVTYDL